MVDGEKVIYSINIEDVQNVAGERLDRHLNEEELKRVEDKAAISIGTAQYLILLMM